MELSPYISLCPIPHRFAFSPGLSLTNEHKTQQTHTLGYTYCADEPLHTVLRHTVHMCEMLLQVYAREFNLAQRALDSLRVGRKEGK